MVENENTRTPDHQFILNFVIFVLFVSLWQKKITHYASRVPMNDPQTKTENPKYDELVRAADEMRGRAYAPYSGFRVGAALLAGSGAVYRGCNVENAAYSPTICAERVALGSAIAAGEPVGGFVAIAIVADSVTPTSPCGVCRQVLLELAPGATVIMVAAPEMGDERLALSVEELLPHGFRFERD